MFIFVYFFDIIFLGDIMLTMKNIIREGNPLLKKKCEPIKWPISEEDKNTLRDMLIFVINSQNEEMAKKHNLRPAVGLAAPQIGVTKRMFAMVCNDLDTGKLYMLPIINPEIIMKSKAMTYLPGGEGCLSVDRPTDGKITPRHKEIMIQGIVYDSKNDSFRNEKMKLSGFPAIVFQHEFDHLNGILYVDKMYESLDCKPLFEENIE